jgi:hypothetical protein
LTADPLRSRADGQRRQAGKVDLEDLVDVVAVGVPGFF